MTKVSLRDDTASSQLAYAQHFSEEVSVMLRTSLVGLERFGLPLSILELLLSQLRSQSLDGRLLFEIPKTLLGEFWSRLTQAIPKRIRLTFIHLRFRIQAHLFLH